MQEMTDLTHLVQTDRRMNTAARRRVPGWLQGMFWTAVTMLVIFVLCFLAGVMFHVYRNSFLAGDYAARMMGL